MRWRSARLTSRAERIRKIRHEPTYARSGSRRRGKITVLFVCVGIALAASLIQGGSLDRLAATRFRYPWLVFGGLALQVLAQLSSPSLISDDAAFWILLAGTGAVGVFLLMNVRLSGLALAGLGLLLNVAVIATNGGMPVSRAAAEAAHVPITEEEAGVRHEVLDEHSALPFLSDAIPVPPFKTVLSLGDVFLALGLALFVYRAAAEPRGKRAATEASG